MHEFDPYHKWLGIPKTQRPPTHYQLLAIAPSETDPEVIEEAALGRTNHLRLYQSGQHAARCARLLEEIAAAANVLLDPAKRAEYDRALALRLPTPTAPLSETPTTSPAIEPAPVISKWALGQGTVWLRRPAIRHWLIAGILAVSVGVVGIVWAIRAGLHVPPGKGAAPVVIAPAPGKEDGGRSEPDPAAKAGNEAKATASADRGRHSNNEPRTFADTRKLSGLLPPVAKELDHPAGAGPQETVVAAVQGAASACLDADPWRVPAEIAKLLPAQSAAMEQWMQELQRAPSPGARNDAREKLARRQANAAVALILAGSADPVMPSFAQGSDIRRRTYLLERLSHVRPLPLPVAAAFGRATAGELQFDRRQESYVATTYRYTGRQAVTIEAIVTADDAVESSLVADVQRAGLGLRIQDQRWSCLAWLGDRYEHLYSERPVRPGARTHVASVFDPVQGRLELFVNGKRQVGARSFHARFRPSPYPMFIGADPKSKGVAEHFFSGRMKEVRISERAVYQGDFLPPPRLVTNEQTVLMLHFDEGTGAIAFDASRRSHHGRLIQASWVRRD